MSSSNYDRWLADHNSLLSLVDEIMGSINERTQLARTGGNVSKMTVTIRHKISTLNTEIKSLESDLQRDSERRHVTEMELHRRQDLVRNLKNRCDTVSLMFSKGIGKTGDDDRKTLLDNSAGSPRSTHRAFGRRAETEATSQLDNQTLVEQQQQLMHDQDDGLEALQQAISRQKQIGIDISDELDVHNDLLDDLGGATDRTNILIDRETKHVDRVTEKTKSRGMFCIIVLLIITLIIVATVPT